MTPVEPTPSSLDTVIQEMQEAQAVHVRLSMAAPWLLHPGTVPLKTEDLERWITLLKGEQSQSSTHQAPQEPARTRKEKS